MALLINSKFKYVIQLSQIGNSYKNDNIFHNYYRMKKIPKGTFTYNGENNCGITSFILGNILKKYMPIEMYKFQTGYGKYTENHVFLKSNNIIIDPTYRQFFTDNRKNSFSCYNNYLYQVLPPFFVGTYKDLQNMHNVLKEKNKQEFEYSTIDNTILDNWKELYNITDVLDDYNKLNEKDLIYEVISKI